MVLYVGIIPQKFGNYNQNYAHKNENVCLRWRIDSEILTKEKEN